MRNRILLLITLWLGGLWLAGCAVHKQMAPNLTKISYRDLLAHNEQWQTQICTLQGTARITLDSPQYSGNFGADIYLNGKDSLLINVTGPMGLPMGKVFIAKTRFIFYNQIMNQFLTGSRSDFEGTNFFQFPLQITELGNVLLARDSFDILKKSSYEIRDGSYYLEAANGHYNYRIWFDPTLLMITKIEYLDRGQLVFYKTYAQFEKFNGIYFPRSVNFVRPAEKQGLAIYYSDLKLNETISTGAFEIKVSDSAKQIDLSTEQ